MALIFTVLCGLAALSLGYFINYFAKGHFVDNTEAVIDTEIRYIEAMGVDHLQNTNRLYITLDSDGRLPADIPTNLSRLAEGILVFVYPPNNKKYAAKIHTFPDNQKILIGTDITEISKQFQVMQWMGIISIGFVMLVVFVAFLISVFVVNGTNKIANTAREIIHTGDLSRRVDVGSRWDDLSNMAAVLNLLLDRVEELMRGVREVSDNIAHDLRTPLTRIRSTIEALNNKDLLHETDQLLSTFNALLRISRIESEQQRSNFERIALHMLLEDVIAFYEPLAEKKHIRVSHDLQDVSKNGDRDLLFQAFANLLDNAVKFTPENGGVHIRLYAIGNKAHIEIADTGTGIPPEDQDKIFDRFYRGAKCRSTSGTGLGLSLVSAVITLHHGQIEVENTQPGLKIITSL